MTLNIFSLNGEWDIILAETTEKKYHSLRWTLLVTYICVGILPVLFFANTMFQTMDKYFIEERKKELLSHANIISGHISISNYLFDDSKKLLFDYNIEESSKDGNFRIIVLDATGTVVNDSVKEPGNTYIGKTFLIPEVLEALNNKDVANMQDNETIYAAVSIVDSNSQKVGVVLVSALATDVGIMLDGVKKQVYILLGCVVFLVAVLIFVLSKTFTEPLKQVIDVIKEMSYGHLDKRVKHTDIYNNEISDLAEACNNMADKLEQVESSRQLFVSNVSHELKTPLSSIKVLSESILLEKDVPKEMYVEFLMDINSEIDRMAEIINDLLTLVKLDQKEIPADFKEQNINSIVEAIIKRLQPLATIKEIDINLSNEKDVIADIDKTKFTLAISNLIENGIKYTPDGGEVSVTVDADHQNAFITVSDTGIGIAENELGKIFDRFYRVDKTRDRQTGGTGLGLSITHSTVLIHNGSIKVSSHEGEGTTFVVRIPLHQQ